MSEMMAYCGLLCNECPAYKATVGDDWPMRKEVAENWSKAFGKDFSPEDINCLGCRSDVLSGYCRTCEIRVCAREKTVEDCGKCTSFACGKVEGILKHDGGARERLSRK